MLFNSISFSIFFPIVFLIYFAIGKRQKIWFLLIASCLFYMWTIPVYIFVLFATILIDYFAALAIDATNDQAKKKIWFWISVISTCLILFIFKYFNFFIDNFNTIFDLFGVREEYKPFLRLALPVGLSFHTFQSLSYVIEVYRGHYKAEKDFVTYALYVMFFPQLVAGPIERPQNILPQFHQDHQFNYLDVKSGFKLFVWGMFKKVVIADRLSLLVDQVYNTPEQYNGLGISIATIFFAIQIYCDFSGYSDMAIGVARVLGYRLMVNFNRPYFSYSISEFWRRWHISLSTWFKDYVYVPLGGNHGALHAVCRNLFITFALSGFWHGANWTYIVWGSLNGFYLIVGQVNKKIFLRSERPRREVGNLIITFALISFSWIFFRANSIQDAFTLVRRLSTGWDDYAIKLYSGNWQIITDATFMNIDFGGFSTEWFLLSWLYIIFLFISEYLMDDPKYFNLFKFQSSYARIACYYIFIVLIVICGTYGENSFIYFQF